MGKLVENNIPRVVIGDINSVESSKEMLKYKESLVCFLYFDDCESLFGFNITIIDKPTRYILVLDYYEKNRCDSVWKYLGRTAAMSNVIIITKDYMDNTYKILTFMPKINPRKCILEERIKPKQVGACNSVLDSSKLFPIKKPKNFYKCPFKVGVRNYKPFFIINNTTDLKFMDIIKPNDDRLGGIDLKILKILAIYLNATLQMHYLKHLMEPEYVTPLLNGSLDANAGGFYRIYGNVIEYSPNYGTQMLFWAYSVVRSHSWHGIICKLDLLFLFFLFYLYYSIIWYVLCLFEERTVSFKFTLLNSWGCLFGCTELPKPMTIKQKILNACFLFMCVHFIAYVSIELYSNYTIAKPPKIYRTNKEIMNSDKKPYVYKSVVIFIQEESFKLYIQKADDCKSFDNCSAQILRNDGVTVSIDNAFARFQVESAVNSEAGALRVNENIVSLFHTILIRKDSYVVKHLQNAMKRLSEAGIFDKFYRESVGLIVLDKSKILTKSTKSNSYSCQMGCSINLSQIVGILYIWMIGCFVSILIFIIEVYYKKTDLNDTRKEF
ncbi:uncharacterized protein LOC131851350 [Achroia grisella]|uniref:uncharacterized protein LOC131851350 n=1 Tax=Achroia grisella TaxID=688607 RepID=UPI0027D21F0B|nr:uncharacterized protein LOC131851350 [Achroia grisella]